MSHIHTHMIYTYIIYYICMYKLSPFFSRLFVNEHLGWSYPAYCNSSGNMKIQVRLCLCDCFTCPYIQELHYYSCIIFFWSLEEHNVLFHFVFVKKVIWFPTFFLIVEIIFQCDNGFIFLSHILASGLFP